MKAIHLPLRTFDLTLPWHERLTRDEFTLIRGQSCRSSLYRFYDADRRLLYVGISVNPLTRWEWHSTHAKWWRAVRYLALSAYQSRIDCALAEGAAMYHERPLFNVQYPRPRTGRRSPENPKFAPPLPRFAGEG